MEKFLVLRPLLRKISDGKFFTTIFFWLFRGLACLNVLAVLWVSWKLWGNLSARSPLNFFIAALLAEAFLITIGFTLFNILWIRASDIVKLPLAKDYSITPIMVISIKASGEILASLTILFGLALSLTTWIAGSNIMKSLPFAFFLPGMSGTGSNALSMIFGIVSGVVILAASYFIAETCGALVDIARNTKKGR